MTRDQKPPRFTLSAHRNPSLSARIPFLLVAFVTLEAVILGALLASTAGSGQGGLVYRSESGLRSWELSAVAKLDRFGEWGYTVSNGEVSSAMMRVYDSNGNLINTRKQLRSPYCAYGDPDRTPTNPCYIPNLPDGIYRVEIEAHLADGGELTGHHDVIVGEEPSEDPPAKETEGPTAKAEDPTATPTTAPQPPTTTSAAPTPTASPLPSTTVVPSNQSAPDSTGSSALVRFGDWGYTSNVGIASSTMWVYNASGGTINIRSQQRSPYCAYGDPDKTPTNPCYEPSLSNGTYRVRIVANLTSGGQISAEHYVTVGTVPSTGSSESMLVGIETTPSATATASPTATTTPMAVLPAVTATVSLPGGVKAIPADGRITSSGVYTGNISSSSGDCVVVTADDVTIKDSDLGPCNGRGVYVNGVRNFNLLSSTVDNNKSGSCCEHYTTVLVRSSQNVLIQGNVLKRGETIIEVVGSSSSNVTIQSNQAYDPKGPFPRGQFVQVQNDAGPVTISNNSYSCRASSGCQQEDAINLYRAHDVTVVGNSLDSGGAIARDSGCGIISEGVNTAVIRSNTLRNQYHGSRGGCGIGISSGQNILVEGNDVSGYGNIAYYVADYSSWAGGCNNITIRNNYAGKRPDGTSNPFWTSSSCGPNKSITGNSWQ